MEGQSSAGNSQYQYQATQWSRLVRRNTLAAPVPSSSLPPSIAITSQLPPQLDLIPILLPQQQSSYHQAQLAQYNRLITAGRTSRLQSSPLPPLLSTQHIQAVPGQRSSSSSGTTARHNNSSVRGGHGNKESRKSSKGESALVTEKDKAAKMAGKKAELNQLPIRPHAQHHNTSLSHQSSSVPSTPHQHARKFSSDSREPSPNATNNHSPRSAYSESNIFLPPKPHPIQRGGCKYETAMANTRRRMPYSLGGDKLDKIDASKIKSKLSEDEERKLSTDMRDLYDRLLPTPKSESNRETLVQKLENLFNGQWPGHDIRVHVFGSSGNMLCTDSSDVDICITTEWKAMEEVCMVADLLAKNGMEKVICVPNAKVPIVKIWDPVLELACDMNVNNPLALENTRMIKTYIQIDPRVRPLAMIIKHWTKQRIINDAAFGCTLSSYTWICMIIYFLQSRNPPILPALHQRPHNKLPPKNGVESAFADDLDALAGFGKKNQETIGELLFQFFRFYGHEFDYETSVISVRNGKKVTKVEKRWDMVLNNHLCVEEPFNVGRNLGNTADEASFRGLHMELRRAFDLIAQGKLDECCEQYIFPKEEERPLFTRPVKKPTPILRHASQSNRGSIRGRGGRHNQHNRNGNSNRRASSGAFDLNPTYIPGIPPNLSSKDAWLQRQAQAQLHNELYATYSVLQAQENSLRLQLYAQGLQNQVYAQSQAQGQANGTTSNQQPSDRNRTNSFDQPPLTAPIRPDMYFYPLHYPATQGMYGYQTPTTNPSSPSLSSATPELRRGLHRSTVTNGSGQGGQPNSALRSQSQPATRSGHPLQGNGIAHTGLGIYQSLRPVNGNAIPSFIPDENSESLESSYGSLPPPSDNTTPKEYVGYYVNDPTQFWRRQSAMPPPIPTFGDLGHTRTSLRRSSIEQLPQSILDRMKRPSRSPSPLGHDRSYSTGAPLMALPTQNGVSNNNLRVLNNQTPAVVNGSSPVPLSIPNWQASISDGTMSEDRCSDILVGSLDSLSQLSRAGSDASGDQDMSGQLTPRDVRQESQIEPPMVVNGSAPVKNESRSISSGSTTSNGNLPQPLIPHTGLLPVDPNGPLRLSPNSRNRSARQNGGVSPLDIGLSQDLNRDDLAHLSPVYETRTPSPTVNRKFEPTEKKVIGIIATPGEAHGVQKPDPANGNHVGQVPPMPKTNGHTRASKSEGAPGNWQKAQKSKKKVSSEAKGANEGKPHGEKLPTHLNERKGG